MVKSGKSSEPIAPLRTAVSGPVPRRYKENLEDKIYDRLKAMIVDRALLPGERLQLTKLGTEMRVSRTPLINALKRLAAERLVEWVNRHGFYVRRFTRREMADLFEIRVALESLAARLATERMRDAEIEELEAMFRGLEVPANEETPWSYVILDRQFHWRIVELSGNPQLVTALGSINMQIFAYQFGMSRSMAESLPEHHEILRALRNRDAALCEQLMREHHGRTTARLRQMADLEEHDRQERSA
jgi:DNA-binding GntR family transcriptional regulator